MSYSWGPFKKKPNILILITDQQRSEQHFPKGWSERHLPWLTQLKKTGITFSKGMCSSTACSPSRSTIFSSTYPTINGVLKVNDSLKMQRDLSDFGITGDLTTLGLVMQEAGYDMVYKGKWHLDAEIANMSNVHPAYKDIMMVEDDAMETEWSFPGWTSPDFGTEESGDNSTVSPAQYSFLNTLGDGRVKHDNRVVNGPLYSDTQQSSVDFLKNYDPNSEKPFCLVVSLANPHDIWVYPYSLLMAGYTDPVWHGINYDYFKLPESYKATLVNKPSAQSLWLELFQNGPLANDDMALEYVKFYAYLQTLVDELTGDIINAMHKNNYTRDLVNDTVIVRLSDHGEMAMAQAGTRQKENNCYNETIRVPIIFSNPRLLNQGIENEAMVGLIDLIPTLAEIGGVSDPSENGKYFIQGKSLGDLILHPKQTGPDQFLFCTDDLTNLGGKGSTSIRAIVEKDWKYAVYYQAAYDSSSDCADSTSSDSTTTNPNGAIAEGTTAEFELYNYSDENGWNEINNLIQDNTTSKFQDKWQELHTALTQLLTDNHTSPDCWEDIVIGSTD